MDSLMSFDAFLMGNRSNGNGGERRKGVMMECFFNKDTSYGSIMERTHQCHHHQNHDGSKIGDFGGSEKGELMIDLNLGRLVCGTGNSASSSSLNNVKEKVMSLSSSSLLKRGRSSCSSSASSAGGQIPRCQVQGCNLDLSCSKEYHKRHKVCDVHSKTTKVIVNDLEQRFCQQCSRFHLLVEFDEAKRSCRKRLAGHNERRRKPQVAVYSGKAGKLLPVYQGSRYPGNSLTTSYIGQNVFGNGHLHEIKFGNGNWFRPVKKEGDEAYNSKLYLSNVNQPSVLKPSHGLYGSREQISSFSNAASGTVGSDNNSDNSQMFTPPLSQSLFQTSPSVTFTGFDAVSSVPSLTRVSDSVCALSLLSTQSWSSSTHFLGTAIPSPLMVQGENALHNSGHFPDKLVAIGSQMSSSVESNRFSSSGIHSAEDDLVSGMKVPDISTVMGFGAIHADNVFQGLDLARANPSHTTEQTIDLLQLSSMLQNAEQQRHAEQERQGNEPFDWRHLA